MNDVAPELLEAVKKSFDKDFTENKKISDLQKIIKSGQATYEQANEFAIETGQTLAKAFKENLSGDVLPDGKMYYNIAEAVIKPSMENNYDIISEATVEIQASLNKNSKIGIKALEPELNTDRIDGIVNKVSNAENFDDVKWVLDEPVVNFSQSVVDDTLRTNVEFQHEAGLTPKIVRKVTGNCCKWCSSLAGKYSYPDVPKDVYRRHQRCRCTVEYDPGDGKVQNVHTKKWQSEAEHDKIEQRKTVGLKQDAKERPQDKEQRIKQENGLTLPEQIARHPQMLQAYTPQELKDTLEKMGYEVKPLGKGNYKGVAFEDGGGFRVNYGGDGLFQYHPENRSHHQGAYYKTSSGKGGVERYDLDGNKKDT